MGDYNYRPMTKKTKEEMEKENTPAFGGSNLSNAFQNIKRELGFGESEEEEKKLQQNKRKY